MPPWERYQQAAQPSSDPVIARDPYKTEDQQFQRNAEARATQDQALQIEAAKREAERLRLSRENEARQQAEFAGTGGKPTEAQQKTSILLSRVMGGFKTIIDKARDNPEAQEPGIVESMRGDLMPGGITGIPARAIAGEDRRIIHDAQRDVLDSLLTMSTGAAYTPEQLSGQMASYFPAYGDTQDEIAVKNNRMRLLIEAAKVNAGPKWGEVETAIEPYIKSLDTTVPAGSTVKDGKIYGPEGGFLGVSPGAPDGPFYPEGNPPPSDGGGGRYSMDNIASALKAGVGDIVEGAANIPGMIVNPINTAIFRGLGYDGYTSDIGQTARESLGLPEGNQTVSAINQAGTAALTGSLAARGASAIANPGATRNALAQFGATPGRDLVAGAGAGLGSDVARQADLGPAGQIAGALVGGLTGYRGANALMSLGNPRAPSALLQSADDLGVTMLPADVGGVGTRMASGAFGRTLGGIPMAEGAQKAVASAAGARGRIASSVGDVTDNVGAGQAVKRGFGQWTNSSLKRGDELFESVSVPGEAKVQLGQTRNALSEVTRGMQSNPELSRLWANHPRLRQTLEALTPKDVAPQGREAFAEASERLQTLLRTKEAEIGSVPGPHRTANLDEQIAAARQDLASARQLADTSPQGGELSWQDMKRFRSIVGEIIGQPGIKRDGSDIAALRKLYGALTSDMEVTAAQTGPKALREFSRANQFWRGRESRIDDVFASLLGKDGNRSDEGVFKQINSWAKGDNGDFSRIARTIRSMPADEANTIRATLIQRMGMAKPANQDATGEVFSPALFSSEWRGLSDRAKNVLFPNKQHRDDLEKLADIAGGMKRAEQYQNFSNTSLGVNLTAQSGLALANLPVAIALAGIQYGGGMLLASPRFARIIASSAKLPAEQQGRRIVEQLGVLATREPLIANDARALQQHLQQAFGQSPSRAAASEEEQDRRRPPVNR